MEIISSKTELTEEQYKYRVELLEKRFADDSGEDPHEHPGRKNPLGFVQWFITRAAENSWAKRTYWLYRSALLWFFSTNGIPEAITALKRTSSAQLNCRGTRTSSNKLKKLPDSVFTTLIDTLGNGKGHLDKLIAQWLKAGLVTGLRPVEWEHAVWMPEKHALEVLNAKRDVYRGNGERRIIIYDPALHQDEISNITTFLYALHEKIKDKQYNDIYQACRKRLLVVSKKLWPKSKILPSLYSTRHQFAANMKASGLTAKQVAALMGHSSEETAQCHYARKRSGNAINPPSSPASDIGNVRQTHREHPHQANLFQS